MAGPGLCKIRDTGQEMDGSPLIALKHPFTDYTFVENHPICALAKYPMGCLWFFFEVI
jgi:hypothetical protein